MLRNLVHMEGNEVIVDDDAPTYNFTYDENKNTEHTIHIRIPGKKTFQDRNNNLQNTIQRNDFKIMVQLQDDSLVALTHEQVVRDLYNKINGEYNKYNFYKGLLSSLHLKGNLNTMKNVKKVYEIKYDGYSLPLLISFIRWCGVQETINYPNGWGKDLSFSRYFEAIYSGYTKDKKLLKTVCERTNYTGKPQPLFKPVYIDNKQIDIYNNCLNNRR